MPALNVWMNGEFVGEWNTGRAVTPTFTYAQAWLDSPSARALSLSLPITTTRQVVGARINHYFDNLLPDNPGIRNRVRDRLGLKSSDTFDLLEAIGRDCAGAVQILPPREIPTVHTRIDATRLSEQGVVKILASVTSARPLGGMRSEDDDDALRISIAGAQEKTALLYMGGAWHRAQKSTPTTHILKLPLGIIGNFQGDFSHSVENEWLCAQFLTALGLQAADTDIATFDGQRVLVVRRFDRRWVGVDASQAEAAGYEPRTSHWIARLPQEDFCQATGRSPQQRYEADGGPSINEILDILAQGSESDADRRRFVLTQLVFWLLAATDGHGKNFSIGHRPGNEFSLTKLYDVLSAWPIIGPGRNQLPYQDAKLAMAISGKNRNYKIGEIHARHFHQLALRVGGDELWQAACELVERAPGALAQIIESLPPDFPEVVATKITLGVAEQSQRFLHGAAHV
jgi:serine/threonine-protein kinase HipA